MFNFNNFIHYLPEVVIVFSILLQIFCSVFNFKRISTSMTAAGLALSLYFLISAQVWPTELYSFLFKIMILISSLLILFLKTKRVFVKYSGHFNTLYLFSVLFLLMIADSTNYLSLYLNIELFSLCMYFLFSMDKKAVTLAESYKYLVLSVTASAFILSGAAFLYGLTGTFYFQGISEFINTASNYSFSTYVIPFFFIITGLCFKLGVFPFGNWIIDVYKNVDTKVAAFISTAPKLAIFSVLVKILGSMITFESSFILILFALFTAGFGVIYGLRSNNLKEIMAASSYINISYLLIALALYTKLSIATMLFYWAAYVFMNIGAFAGIISLEHSNQYSKEMDFRGYFYKNPLFSICFAVCIIGLLGFPITSGFIAKIYLLSGVLNSGIIILPVILFMILFMVVSVCFYLSVIKKMFESIPYENMNVIKCRASNSIVLYICTFMTICLGALPAGLIKMCEYISLYIFA